MIQKIILFSLEILSCLSLFSQPRQNRSTNVQILKISPMITNIVGWNFDEYVGKWSACYNCIPENYVSGGAKYPRKIKEEVLAAGENIMSLRFRKVIYNSNNYYIMTLSRYNGVYMYPTICRDWRYWKETEIYLLFPDEYKKLSSAQKDVDITVYYTMHISNQADVKTLQQSFPYIFMGKEMDVSMADKEHSKLHFFIHIEDDKVVRFEYPTFSDINPFTTNIEEQKKNTLFYKQCYYEVSKLDFFNMINFDL